MILATLEQGLVQRPHDPLREGSHDWQELSSPYCQVTLARTRLQHSLLLHYLLLYWPEFARYWQSTRAAWFIRFLQRFPTPAAVRLLTRDEFVATAGELVGRKVRKRAFLDEVDTLAQSRIGLPVALDSPAIAAFQLQLARYAELNRATRAAGSPRPRTAGGRRGLPAPVRAAWHRRARRAYDPG